MLSVIVTVESKKILSWDFFTGWCKAPVLLHYVSV